MLCRLLGIGEEGLLSETIHKWIDGALSTGLFRRKTKWTKSIAVGDQFFVKETKDNLGAKAIGRKTVGRDKEFQLRELLEPYNNLFLPKKGFLRPENGYFWNIYPTIRER